MPIWVPSAGLLFQVTPVSVQVVLATCEIFSVPVSGLLVVSCLAGLVTPVVLKLSPQQDLWWAIWNVALPQACLDAVIGGAIYWLMWSQFNIEQLMSESRM